MRNVNSQHSELPRSGANESGSRNITMYVVLWVFLNDAHFSMERTLRNMDGVVFVNIIYHWIEVQAVNQKVHNTHIFSAIIAISLCFQNSETAQNCYHLNFLLHNIEVRRSYESLLWFPQITESSKVKNNPLLHLCHTSHWIYLVCLESWKYSPGYTIKRIHSQDLNIGYYCYNTTCNFQNNWLQSTTILWFDV